MKELILLRGVSGSGKTTLAELFETLGGYTHPADGVWEQRVYSVSADDYFTDKGKGRYNFKGSELGKAHWQCRERTWKMMCKECPVIVVHNTFTTEEEMKPYFELAEGKGYRVTTLIVENRHNSESIHNVPVEALNSQRERFDIQLCNDNVPWTGTLKNEL